MKVRRITQKVGCSKQASSGNNDTCAAYNYIVFSLGVLVHL
jgi:hypothetical protein